VPVSGLHDLSGSPGCKEEEVPGIKEIGSGASVTQRAAADGPVEGMASRSTPRVWVSLAIVQAMWIPPQSWTEQERRTQANELSDEDADVGGEQIVDA